MANGLVTYDAVTSKPDRGGATVPSEWDWTCPLKDWNLFSSIVMFPCFPLPPFSVGSKDYRGIYGGRTLPDVRDLLIVRDSSGSMSQVMKSDEKEHDEPVKMGGRANSKFNLSSIASFAAIHSAATRGADIAVINFSGGCIETPWMKPNDRGIEAAEKMVLSFLAGTTLLPIDAIKQKLSEKSRCFVLVITDSLLYNWNDFFKYINDFTDKGHYFSMMFIIENKKDLNKNIISKLDEKYISIHYIKTPSDLVSITLKEINRVYA
jgi:hypothetical protein